MDREREEEEDEKRREGEGYRVLGFGGGKRGFSCGMRMGGRLMIIIYHFVCFI